MNNLEFAINMEREGENYYTGQAEKNKNNSLHPVFLMLSKDEGIHAGILQKKSDGLSYTLEENSTLRDAKNVFQGIGDFASEIRETPNQLELYTEALAIEKQSIDLYEKLLSETTDEESEKLFEFLIKQEIDHFTVFEELILLLSRPNEWVESAEFGTREEY